LKRKLTSNQDWTECGSLQAGRLEDEEFAQEVSSRKDVRGQSKVVKSDVVWGLNQSDKA
jgi:hypothetical protein